MMKTMKWLIGLLIVVILVIGVAMIFLANNMDRLVKKTIEDVGSQTLGTKVTVDSVDISLIESRGGVWGLKVANPESFDSRYALQVGAVMLDLDPSTLPDRLVTIEEATIDDTRVIAEKKGLTTNLQVLLNNIQQSPKTAGQSPEDSKMPAVRVRIENLVLTDTKVTLTTEDWGSETLEIATMTLNNIGKSKGVPPNQVAGEIMSAIIEQINKAVQQALQSMALEEVKGQIQEKAEEGLEDIKEKTGEGLKGVKEKLGETFKGLTQ